MGTQQLLLIVLGVIIVGIAIAVGITIFNNQAYNANANALTSETTNYASSVLQYWKTPISQGGAGRDIANMTSVKIATFIGFTVSGEGEETTNLLETENGSFKVVGGADPVTIYGLGTEKKSGKYPLVTTTVVLDPGTVTSNITSGTALP